MGFSWVRDQTYISCIIRQILYYWATREAPQTTFKHFWSIIAPSPYTAQFLFCISDAFLDGIWARLESSYRKKERMNLLLELIFPHMYLLHSHGNETLVSPSRWGWLWKSQAMSLCGFFLKISIYLFIFGCIWSRGALQVSLLWHVWFSLAVTRGLQRSPCMAMRTLCTPTRG